MINEKDSLDVAKNLILLIRQKFDFTPILCLTYKNHYRDRVELLHAGSDDVISFPFALEELDARLQSLIRREYYNSNYQKGINIHYKDLELNTTTRMVKRGKITNKLTIKECQLLEYLLKNSGKIVSRKAIISTIWGHNWKESGNLLEVYIRYLRKKIDVSGDEQLIKTIRGVGYTISE